MQETENLPEDAAGVTPAPARRRPNRGTGPWREGIGEFRASGLTIQAYISPVGFPVPR